MENDTFSSGSYPKEYIYSLPLICVTTNNDVTIWVRYDEKNKMGFQCDQSGSFLGDVYSNFDLTPIDTIEQEQDEDLNAKPDAIGDPEPFPPTTENEAVEQTDLHTSETPEKPPLSSVPPLDRDPDAPSKNPVIKEKRKASHAVIIGLLSLLLLINIFNTYMHYRPKPITVYSDMAHNNTPDESAVSNIHILTLNRNVYAGETITADSFSVSTVSNEEYRMLLSIGGVYLETDLPKLTDMKFRCFISSGASLKYSDVVASYLPQNPWEPVYEGYSTVTLPLSESENIDKCLPGSVVKVSVRTKRKTSTPSEDEATSTHPIGIEHNSSVVESTVIDTYDISSAIISDTFNSEKESLFVPYTIIADVPVLFQAEAITALYQDPSNLLPSQITIILPEDQAKLLSEMEKSIESVTITPMGADISDAAKQVTYTQMKQAMEALGGK